MNVTEIVSVILIICMTVCFLFILDKSRKKPYEDVREFDEEMQRLKSKSASLETPNETNKPYSGKTIIGFDDADSEVSIEINSNHIMVCGTTGSGKTVALSNFIQSGINNNLPMLIIDGKGDTGKGSIKDIVRLMRGARKVYTVDFNNPAKSSKYNPFRNASPTIIKDMIINLTSWSEEHYKYNTERYIQRLITIMQKAEIPLCLRNIVASMNTETFILLSTKLLKLNAITKEEHLSNIELSKICGSIANDAAARFSVIVESELGVIFDEHGVDIYQAMQERALILFILNPLMYPELTSLIGNLIVIDAKKTVSKLYDNNVGRIFYIMDEINVYASPSLLDLVNKSRSANITCVLATQSLSDLDNATSGGEHFKRQVIENCNNYLVLRQNTGYNAEQWADIIGTKKGVELTYQLHDSEATGMGSARFVRKYLYHPDYIKNLPVGNGIYINKDKSYHTSIRINKPFY